MFFRGRERNFPVIARPFGPKRSPLKEPLENKYRDTEKQKNKDPEQAPLDQPPQCLPFFFVHGRYSCNVMNDDSLRPNGL